MNCFRNHTNVRYKTAQRLMLRLLNSRDIKRLFTRSLLVVLSS